jgi:hypothetical protein
MLLLFFLAAITLLLYIFLNDRKISRLPPEANAFTPHRLEPADVRATAAEYIPTHIKNQLPPKTGRRYIVVGGVSPFATYKNPSNMTCFREAFSVDGSFHNY